MTKTEHLILEALEAILKSRPSPGAKRIISEIDEHLKDKGQRYREPSNNW